MHQHIFVGHPKLTRSTVTALHMLDSNPVFVVSTAKRYLRLGCGDYYAIYYNGRFSLQFLWRLPRDNARSSRLNDCEKHTVEYGNPAHNADPFRSVQEQSSKVVATRRYSMNTHYHFSKLLYLAILLTPTSCVQTFRAQVAFCELGDAPMVRDVLYFGRNRPTGGVVNDAEWQQFLDEIVTPRFPDGLTIVEATGQWRGKSGAVEQERSEIVTLLHKGDESAKSSIAAITAEYMRRFQQEAVLRERTTTCAKF